MSEVSTLSALSFHLYSPHARGIYNIYIYIYAYITPHPRHDAHLKREGERGGTLQITCINMNLLILHAGETTAARDNENREARCVPASPLPMYPRETERSVRELEFHSSSCYSFSFSSLPTTTTILPSLPLLLLLLLLLLPSAGTSGTQVTTSQHASTYVSPKASTIRECGTVRKRH